VISVITIIHFVTSKAVRKDTVLSFVLGGTGWPTDAMRGISCCSPLAYHFYAGNVQAAILLNNEQ
jgi:hypothetical protein